MDIQEELRNKIGSINAIDGEYDDNLSIALATYFERHPDKPEDAKIDDEIGWSFLAVEKVEDLEKRIADMGYKAGAESMRLSIGRVLLKVRDALVRREIDEAYHELYLLADDKRGLKNPWVEWEAG